MPNYNLTNSFLGTNIGSYSNNASTRTVSAYCSLSASSNVQTPPLSGNQNGVWPTLNFYAGQNSDGITLSATTAPVLAFGSTGGVQAVEGYISTSTYTSAASTFTATVQFYHPNFINTVISLSGNGFNAIVVSTSVIDNPMFIHSPTAAIFNGLSSSNIQFRTVGNHLRQWNLNG